MRFIFLPLSSLLAVSAFQGSPTGSVRRLSPLCVSTRLAQELVTSLVQEEKCFATESGAKAFGDACAFNVVYEDCFEAQPFSGKTVSVHEYLPCYLFQHPRADDFW